MGLDSARGEHAFKTSLAFTIIGTLFCLFRLWIRMFLVKKPGLEDLFIGIATLFSIAFTVLMRVQESTGLGMHLDDVDQVDLLVQLKVMLCA
jgi:hypothetical protein